MNHSESLKEIGAALAKAQGELKNPGFDKQNPHFKSKFASLAGVRDTIMPILTKHGISVIQSLQPAERGIACETMLLHSSGEWISGTLELPVSKEDAQGYGSAATYARRYSLMSFAGVVGDDDDDGNAAVAGKSKETTGRSDQPVIERLPIARQKLVQGFAKSAIEDYKGGSLETVFQSIEEEGLDQDEMRALGRLLEDHSAIRAELKRLGERDRKISKGVYETNGVLQP